MKLPTILCCVLPLGLVPFLPRAVPVPQDGGLSDVAAEPRVPPIEVAAVLAGTWSQQRAQAGGVSLVEEIWSTPQGDNAVGTFRWLAPDGRASMYEILVITREEEGLFLRLRHFGPDLEAWEERDAPKTLRLAEHDGGRLHFRAHAHCGDLSAVTYDRSEEDVLGIEVAFDPKSSRPPLRFRLRRAE